jgi:hypothetical protein
VYRLDIVGMIVSPGASHAFWVDVVGRDVIVVGELYMAERAFSGLRDNLAVEQLPHFCVGAEFPVSPRMMGILNPLYTQLFCLPGLRDRFPAAAGEGVVDGTIFITAKFHWISSG